jgi:hypothetical protein
MEHHGIKPERLGSPQDYGVHQAKGSLHQLLKVIFDDGLVRYYCPSCESEWESTERLTPLKLNGRAVG